MIIKVNEVVKETDDAVLLDCEGDQEWFPKSQITLDMDNNQLEMPDWLFYQKFPNG